ncbi:hypothetical protein PY254_13790 [Rhodanobacter sp. AS-Z3]|uniref:hypothetical protein n=1 Tax=Rhodanobacter sp. AS-Z3 TaxID=3031330 RepID=UPI00247A8EF4|nr:hypothetical protein [Rhodanobacter sp. AS-Z3]WEN14301.1 hypothetical protein PY254_13790 [Rhodanobacter sp. AS-Z3]
MKRILAAIALAMLVAGCHDQSDQAKKAVMATLKDPASVQWRDIRAQPRKDSWGKEHPVICGEYNAKNSYGGYTGFKPFIFEDNRLHIDDDIAMWLSDCQ